MLLLKRIFTVTFISFFLLNAYQAHANKLKKVKLQLRWHHQYQFAGYYAAKHKGFYDEAGFDVELIAGNINIQPVNELLAGNVDYAVGNGEVLSNRLNGKPLVALAAMFQESPSVLLTLEDSKIEKVKQLKNKKVMLLGNSDVDLVAMLRADGLNENQIVIQESSYQLDDLINGTTDAFNSYRTNEPFYLEELGIAYNVLAPSDYNVDFYSDILFTNESHIKDDPKAVERFKQASLKGWQYAVNNSEEIIQIIYQHYNKKKSLNHMRYEALTVNSLVTSKLVPIGHIYEERMHKMADIFIEQNMVFSKETLDGFIFTPPQAFNKQLSIWLLLISIIILLFIATLVFILKINYQLKSEIKLRIKGEEQLSVLASTDSLTGLLNRRAFIKEYEQYQNMATRYQQPLCIALLDIDDFKVINDTYGHHIGDDVLIKATELLKSTLRDVDICGRFGGEEFIVLLPNTTHSQANTTIERVRQSFEKNTLTYPELPVLTFTASFGFTESKSHSFQEVLKEIDYALYIAKSAGKNKVVAANAIK